jgi:hypothetical protein
MQFLLPFGEVWFGKHRKLSVTAGDSLSASVKQVSRVTIDLILSIPLCGRAQLTPDGFSQNSMLSIWNVNIVKNFSNADAFDTKKHNGELRPESAAYL